MFKRNYKQILFTIILISVLVFGIKQYLEKRMYEEFVSHIITNNSQELIQGILQVNTIYNEILDTNKLTFRQLRLLNLYSTKIPQALQYNLGLAQQFGLYEERIEMKKLKEDLHEIDQFYSHLLKSDLKVIQPDEKFIEIDSNLKEKLKYLHELNGLLLNSINGDIGEVNKEGDEFVFNTRQFQEQYWKRSISNGFWVDLLIDISAIHSDFLDKYNIYSIREVLK